MKKRKLKKWVKNLLMGVIILAFVVIGAEQKDLSLFFATKLIAGILILVCGNILVKEEK